MAMAELMGATGMSEPLDTNGLLRYDLDAGDGLSVKVASDPLNTWGTYAVGHSLWTAAPELINLLAEALPRGSLHGQHMIELGAGLGTVGIALALRGAQVTLTDLPACLELMRYNVEINVAGRQLEGAQPRVAVEELTWGEARPPPWARPGGYDWVLASDVCYDGDRFQPLIDTMLQLAALNPATRVVLSLPDRTETRDFFPLASAAGFAWRVLRRVRRPDLVHAVHVYQLVLRHGAATEGMAHPQQPRLMALWDFDWTMVENNSDTWVVERLGAKPDFLRLQKEVVGWTQLMDASMAAAAARGADEAAVRAAARSVPIAPEIVQAVRAAAAAGVRQVIVSDANSVFIEELLTAHNLQGCFAAVHTNPAAFEDGALRVRPHHAEPPLCDAPCPDNMCKGKILERVLLAEPCEHVVYLGDARGDLCPCTRLGPMDTILARSAYPDGRPATLLPLLAAESAVIRAADGTGLPTMLQPAGSGGGSPPAAALPPAAGGSGGSSSSAAWTQGGTHPEGRTAGLVRQLAADAARVLDPTGNHQAPHPALQPLQSASRAGAAQSQQPSSDDAVAQRRAHQVPGTGSQANTQDASADPAFTWPAGDVAAPVQVWSTPQECAELFTSTLRGWAASCSASC